MVISRATEVSADLVRLYSAYLDFYDRPQDSAQIKAFLAQNMQQESTVLIVGSVQDQAIGFTQSYVIPCSLSLGRKAILNDLFVDPHFRGRGYGETLLNQTTDYLASLGVEVAELSTGITNMIGQSLYEKSGWRRDRDFLYYLKPLAP
ncbi:MAG TPA: GNAT family N-acetyltransferase [Fimbriimonadaceae bacterium]|nr:GNAT family N-acetyltransferase [Fimbriimonadaceae bacterium]HRJ33991.1 GNAT family N-acetyltransferase [Fimbriimonadaceae bacterium]